MVYSFSCFAWNLMVREMQRLSCKVLQHQTYSIQERPFGTTLLLADLQRPLLYHSYLISVVLNPDWCRVRSLPPNHNVELDVAHCPTQGVSVSTALSAISCRSTVLSVAWGPSDWGFGMPFKGRNISNSGWKLVLGISALERGWNSWNSFFFYSKTL